MILDTSTRKKREDGFTARYNIARPEFPLICRDVRLRLHRIVVCANLKSVGDDRVVRNCNRLHINVLQVVEVHGMEGNPTLGGPVVPLERQRNAILVFASP